MLVLCDEIRAGCNGSYWHLALDCNSLNHTEITTEVGVIFRLLITLYLSQRTTDFAFSTEDL